MLPEVEELEQRELDGLIDADAVRLGVIEGLREALDDLQGVGV